MAETISPPDLHPRPQLRRDRWIDLCGAWGFAFDDEDIGLAERWFDQAEPFSREIMVPFPPESERSGVHDTGFHPVVWYRREIQIGDGGPPGPAHAPFRCRRLQGLGLGQRPPGRRACRRADAVLSRHRSPARSRRRTGDRRPRRGRATGSAAAARQAVLGGAAGLYLVSPDHRHLAAGLAGTASAGCGLGASLDTGRRPLRRWS